MTDITVGDAVQFGMVFEKNTITVLKGKAFLDYWCGLKEKAEKLEAIKKWHENWFRHTGSHFPKLQKILYDQPSSQSETNGN